MKTKKQAVKKTDKKDEKATYTCVCSMEWRGPHNNEWDDCICYTDETNNTDK